jgi:hypothetical protein
MRHALDVGWLASSGPALSASGAEAGGGVDAACSGGRLDVADETDPDADAIGSVATVGAAPPRQATIGTRRMATRHALVPGHIMPW